MFLNEVDTRESDLSELNSLLEIAPPETKKRIEREIRMIKSGVQGEKQVSFHLEQWKSNVKTAVIHGLRLEVPDGRVAQIDHLFISNSFRFYVLETKNFSSGVRIQDDGQFERWNDFKKNYEAMESPIEQNRRHCEILEKTLKSLEYPEPVIKSYVLIDAKARLIRPKTNTSISNCVIKSDQFASTFSKDIDSSSVIGLLSGLLNSYVSGSAIEVGKKLLSLHKPICIDYRAKFGLSEKPKCSQEKNQVAVVETKELKKPNVSEGTKKQYFCAKCRAEVSEQVAKYCWSNKQKFGGKVYCISHQQSLI